MIVRQACSPAGPRWKDLETCFWYCHFAGQVWPQVELARPSCKVTESKMVYSQCMYQEVELSRRERCWGGCQAQPMEVW